MSGPRFSLRLLWHVAFVLVLGLIGWVGLGGHVFPALFQPQQAFMPLLGVTATLLGGGAILVAVVGFDISFDLIKGKYSPNRIPKEKLIDLLCGSQYLMIGIFLAVAQLIMVE